MPEYIKREDLLKWMKEEKPKFHTEHGYLHGITVGFDYALKFVKQMPAADVVEVVHGHNKTSMHPVDEFLCSVCGFCCADYTETKYDEDGDYEYSCECEFDYCPKCGAKMDGERRSEK